MEIKVDLSEVFDGEEPLSIEEAIKHEVIRSLTAKIKQGIEKQVQCEVSRVINEELAKAVQEQMPTIINDLLNAEYVMVSRYGDVQGMTTFRKELVKVITENMVYKKTQYASDRNAFTKAVDEVIAENVKTFQAEFNSLVTTEFAKESLAHAVAVLKKKLGIDVK